MEIKDLKPRKALNKAFLKVKPNRSQIERFKTNLIQLIDRSNDSESEEFHKNLVSDFLKKTYYDRDYFINTKGRNDLVIHNGATAKTPVGVILEAKKPTNKAEMIKAWAAEDSPREMLFQLNKKAFQELVLYYLRERITHKNLEVKHLIITNIYEWYIFDARVFDRLFAQNKNLVQQFQDFEEKRLAGTNTNFFYEQIAKPFIEGIQNDIEFTYFDLRKYEKPLRNHNKEDDKQLISLFKLLSPEHLLKLPFANDSNSLDKRFYAELLHIIGLTEIKEKSKKLIGRNKEGQRHSGAILENAVIQLESLDKISRLDNASQYGATAEERLFNVALELSITWINRILFLKLLEAQLMTYHNGEKSHAFLDYEKIGEYDDLNSLFFQVLAKKPTDRIPEMQEAFGKVPYLNSSLFEPTELEHDSLFISNLKDGKSIPILPNTVLTDRNGKKRQGQLSTLEYLFAFLNAYDFSSEGAEDIQEDNKTLINASVLGLIFEKINGYKDGSFFTPGFITMYMCRETIRKAVIQKFNEVKNWHCKNLDELYDKIEDRHEANDIVNSLKICDPAVGSGHFLVSALNELIAIKNELKILQDRDGKRLKEYTVEVENDELIVTDEDGKPYAYKPNSPESQRVQETLFHEKQTLIENCLFGVDINPNSVKICRLRLWIELLKNAYYISNNSSPYKGEVSQSDGGVRVQINNLPYLKTFRKELRNNATPAEAKLWTLLKGKALEGRKFRRQHSVTNYILDFYCPAEKLAIELDGQGHFEATQAEYDRERDLFLNAFGIRVLRFENKWVWDNPEGLLEEVKSYFDHPNPSRSEKNHPDPSGHPSLKRGELLQTLPNIDINIKCGNSLVSRFGIDADLGEALKNSKWDIGSYRDAVTTYRNAKNKAQKREMEQLIADIKTDFRSEISQNDPKVIKLRKLSGELFNQTQQQSLFAMSKREKTAWNKKTENLTTQTKKLKTEIEAIKNNKIYENAFEWRFEFPEVLNAEGDFIGFDVVIGNPPYIRQEQLGEFKDYLKAYYKVFISSGDIFSYFYELSYNIIRENGYFSFINNTFDKTTAGKILRNFVVDNFSFKRYIDFTDVVVFEEATTYPIILIAQKSQEQQNFKFLKFTKNNFDNKELFYDESAFIEVTQDKLNPTAWNFINPAEQNILEKISKYQPLKEVYGKCYRGILTGLNDAFITQKNLGNYLVFKEVYEGKDLKKWSSPASFKKMIVFESKSTKEKFGNLNEDEALNKMQQDYPEIFNHIESFEKRAKKRYDKGEYWWELRNCAYYDLFDKPKIIFPNLQNTNKFAFDDTGVYLNAPSVFLPTNDKFLLAILNSKVVWHFLKSICVIRSGGYIEVKPQYFEQIPIPETDEKTKTVLTELTENAINLKKQNQKADIFHIETQIDQLVYALYGLTAEEITVVENA